MDRRSGGLVFAPDSKSIGWSTNGAIEFFEVNSGKKLWEHKLGQPGVVAQEMLTLTLAIVGKTLFDADVAGESQEIGAALGDILQLFGRITAPFAQLLDRLPLPSNRRR